jgi:glutaredoxin-like protein NrdH
MSIRITLYTLSTCSHCKETKKFLNDCGASYEFIDVDMLVGQERADMIDEVKKYNPFCSFPTILIGDEIIVGFQENRIREALGL